jgi:hypothetical protein
MLFVGRGDLVRLNVGLVVDLFREPATLDVWRVQPAYMNLSNTFGSCASGSVAPPTMAASSFVTVRLPRSLPRIRLAIHSSTSISRPAARVGAQLSMGVSGESAMVRDGTGKPDAEAA